MKEEIWKNIEGYEGLYQVSNLGRVKSLDKYLPDTLGRVSFRKEKIICQLQRGGYLAVQIWKKGKNKKFLVHRLVATAFIPNPDNLPQVNHKDENKANNNVDNLEWCTHQYNMDYGTRVERIRLKQLNDVKKSKPVLQYTLDGEFIAEYPSLLEVKRLFNYDGGNIRRVCNGEYKQCYGYKWKFKEKG